MSYGSHLSASTLPPGAGELSLNADALVVDRGLGAQALPNPELGYRRGLGRNLDAGGRLNVGSTEANLRWRFARGRADWTLVPALGFGFVPVTNRDTGLFNAHALTTLLGGVPLSQRSQLVLGARGALTYAFPLTAFRGRSGGDTLYWLVGGVAGYRFPLGERWFAFPELNVLYPYDGARAEWLYPTLQGGIAFQL